jgi:hypothetical protein
MSGVPPFTEFGPSTQSEVIPLCRCARAGARVAVPHGRDALAGGEAASAARAAADTSQAGAAPVMAQGTVFHPVIQCAGSQVVRVSAYFVMGHRGVLGSGWGLGLQGNGRGYTPQRKLKIASFDTAPLTRAVQRVQQCISFQID